MLLGAGRLPRPFPSATPLRPSLRLFPSATPLHPLLYEKKERSGRRKGVADGRLFSGLMAVLSCADHLRSAGPRRSDRRSRVRSAHLGVRGEAAPGAAVREIVG